MTTALVQAVMHRNNGLPQDSIVNTWHFDTTAIAEPADVGAEMVAMLKQFYAGVPAPLPNPIVYYMSPIISGDFEYKVYDLSQTKPRPPVYTETDHVTIGDSEPLPAEVAFCLSYRAIPLAGSIPARYRGRVYIGPLNTRALDPNWNTGDARPVPAFMDTVRQAAVTLFNSPGTASWCGFSPTANQRWDIQEVSTDDAWDTQRRRGADPTARTRVSVGGTLPPLAASR